MAGTGAATFNCDQFNQKFLQDVDSRYSTGIVNDTQAIDNPNEYVPQTVAKIIDANDNSGNNGTVTAEGATIKYKGPGAATPLPVLVIPALNFLSKDTAIGWVQYFIARACICIGDHITATPSTKANCANNETYMSTDLGYFTRSTSCTGLKEGLIGCLKTITTDSPIFELNGTVLQIKAVCPGASPPITNAINPSAPTAPRSTPSDANTPGLALYLDDFEDECKIPVVLMIFLYYGAAYWRAHCYPQASYETDRKALNQFNLDQILEGFKN